MSRRPTFTDRRRAQLARRVAALDAMEERNMITESLGILSLGIGVPTAAAFFARPAAASPQAPPPRAAAAVPVIIPHPARPRGVDAGAGGFRNQPLVPSGDPLTAVAVGGDWLTIRRDDARAATDHAGSLLTAPKPKPPAGGGAAGTSRGGGVGAATGAVTSLRLPPPTAPDAGASGSVVAGALGSALGGGPSTSNARGLGSSSHVAGAGAGSGAAGGPAASLTFAPALLTGPSGGSRSTFAGTLGSASGAALGSFANFPLYTLDYNDGAVLFPGAYQLATLNGRVDLRAQVRDTAVSTYSWDTTHLTEATSITGTSTYNLKFQWITNVPTPKTDSVTLTVTNSGGQTEVQTYTFSVPPGSVGGSGGSTGATWPESLAPNLLLPAAPAFATHNASVDANTGALDADIPLPAYNPNLPALALTYDSLVADARPMVVEHHALDPSLAIPTQVSGQLTFNGTAGTTRYYDTSQFIPGDVQQVALQADATALATGRYAYSVAVGDVRGTTTTTTPGGTATVLNGASSAFGAGWELQGLEKITSATGGVILDLGGGGKSLWFASAVGGSGGGGYTTPKGDFSTLASVSGGGYLRTMPDGTVYRFDGSGNETSIADRNGLRTTFAYSSGKLSTVTDPYAKVTTFVYSGSTLSTITDPAGRVATFAHSGANLTGVTLPDGSGWSYGYDGAGRMTQVVDPNAKATTVAYDAAERVSTITQPDATTETVTAYQERGWTNTGTSGSPAAATLLAEARASFTDPNGHTTDLRPDWNGQGLPNTAVDPDGNVGSYDRDGNGLATIVVDRINRISQYAYDSKGNVTRQVYPDLNQDVYAYNGFAEPTSFTDADGHTTSYSYDGNGNLTSIQDPLNNRTTMTYTGDGKLATAKDANSNVTSYQYDGQDRLTTITYPGAATTLLGYDAYGNPNAVTDERSNVTTYGFDALNRRTGMTDALSNRTTIVYDAAGNPTAVQAPLARTTSYAYDAMDRVTTVADPLAHATVIGYDPAGNARTVADPLSRVTTFAYDAEDRRTVVTDPLGNSTTTAYDAEGQALTVTDPMSRVTSYSYNARGWLATTTDPLGHASTYTYTATGKTSTLSVPVGSGGSTESYSYDNDDRLIASTDANSNTTSYGYDAVGNRTTVTDPLGHVTSSAYDSRNRLTTMTDPLSHSTVYGYDAHGDQVTVKDANANVTTTQYDVLDRGTTMTDARGGATVLAFDAAGRNTVVVDPVGNRTTFAHDAADRLTTMTDPLGNSATYSYDDAGQMTEQTDRDGRRTTFAYDPGGRRTGETWVGASPSEAVTYTYDAANERTEARDANATLTFTYDSGGRQVTAATSGAAGQPNVTLSSVYDAYGNRTSLADNLSSAGVTSYAYDAAFRLTTIATTYGGASGPRVIFGYDVANRPTSTSRTIGGSGTAVATSLAYDNANRLTTITHQVAGGSGLATYVYGYDDGNRATSEQNAEGTVFYSYDATNELTGASGSRSESYGYDLAGNRSMTGYATGGGNQLLNSPGHAYTYDGEGNMITDLFGGVTTAYAYDYRNRLTGVTVGGTAVATYAYDALDRRIGFDDNGAQTWVVWDGQNPYADFNGSGTLSARYLYGPAVDQLLARTESGGTSDWYLTDRQGTIRDLVNALGTDIDHVVYDSFGNVTSESSPSNGDRFKYTAREYESRTGQYYYRSRWYSSMPGRFTSTDPVMFATHDYNLYMYTRNSPINYGDPDGHGEGGQARFDAEVERAEYYQASRKLEITLDAIRNATIESQTLAVARKEEIYRILQTLKNADLVIDKSMEGKKYASMTNGYFYGNTLKIPPGFFNTSPRSIMTTLLHEGYHGTYEWGLGDAGAKPWPDYAPPVGESPEHFAEYKARQFMNGITQGRYYEEWIKKYWKWRGM